MRNAPIKKKRRGPDLQFGGSPRDDRQLRLLKLSDGLREFRVDLAGVMAGPAGPTVATALQTLQEVQGAAERLMSR